MTDLRSGFGELRAAGSFLRGLRPFLRGRVDPPEARRRLERRLAEREQTFARVLRVAVFDNPASPYRKLLDWAGIASGDVLAMLAADGLERTLEQLHDAGVFVALEEFKGLRPLHRPGLEIRVSADEFDNPLSARHFEASTGGSGGTARRVRSGLDLLDHESCYHALFHIANKSLGRPLAMWLPAPPGAVGLKNALISAKLGQPIARWFSQTRLANAPAKHRAFAHATLSAARTWGVRIPWPAFTPAAEAGEVASWMAGECAKGRPALMLTTPSAAVRTCAAAVSEGLDIAGSGFVLVGEPFTAAKAGVLAAAGCQAASHYAMVEAGLIGVSCGAPCAPDDVHLASDKIATIQRNRTVGANGGTVPALLHTTLLPASPKMMLNVESGDYGTLEERSCACDILPRGFRRHLHTIRSYEKLTGEGMHFLGVDLLYLLENLLPARFGGHPTDYQFVERENDRGLTTLSLVVRPSVGELESGEVVRALLEFLQRRGVGQNLMAEVLANAGTLQVVRAEPHVTTAGKIQPLRKASF